MRVTDNISRNQFLTNNNLALTQMLQSENRIATQRRYNRVSEDIINASKDLVVRRQQRDLGIYNDNLSSVGALFFAAEKNLTFIAHDKYISVEEKLTQAANGTWAQEELTSIATELDQIAESMVTTLNNDFSERELFGGMSNGKTPFRLERAVVKKGDQVVFPPDYNKYWNADGTLKDDVKLEDIPRTVTYNGIPLDFDVTSKMVLPDGTVETPADTNSYTVSVWDSEKNTWSDETQDIPAADVKRAIDGKNNSLLYPGSKPVYVDIGLGIKYNDKYEVDPQTALDVSMNGAKITGCGIDMSGVETGDDGKVALNEDGTPDISERFSKNLIQLVLDAATALKRGDQDRVNAIIDRANEANNHILTEITTLGAKQNTIDFYVEKNKDYDYNLKERQNVVEGTDMENEIIRYEAIRAAYDATLKMGSQLLPHSIFDFV